MTSLVPPNVAGRDARLPRWMRAGAPLVERPRYDSVVVRGNGVAAAVFAGRLARSDAFAGRVVIAAPPVSDVRRLIGGLTLRSRALDYFAAALGRPRSALLDRLFGDRIAQAITASQRVSYFERSPDGFTLVRPADFMSSDDHGGRALSYGVRNSHLAARLFEEVEALPVRFHGEKVDTLEACRALAPGSRPLVVDASAKPLVPDAGAAPPRDWVVACQLPFAERARDRDRLPDHSSLFATTLRDGLLDLGIYNPIVDPLSENAAYYGIFIRIVASGSAFEAEQARLRDELVGLGAALGLDPVDPEETEGRAALPVARWRYADPAIDGVLDLQRIVHAGAPIITGDGMTRAGVGGLVAAEAVLAGEDPVPHANRALRGWRFGNWMLDGSMTKMARVAATGVRRLPAFTFRLGADRPDTWAGLERFDG